jgi:hypothetical protein
MFLDVHFRRIDSNLFSNLYLKIEFQQFSANELSEVLFHDDDDDDVLLGFVAV